ncbi:transposase, partial [Oleiphilus sp. HI0043]
MKHYSKEFKEAIVKKWLESGLSLRTFSAQENINLSTLYSWRDKFQLPGSSVTKSSSPDNWSPEAKFSIVLETAMMSEIE